MQEHRQLLLYFQEWFEDIKLVIRTVGRKTNNAMAKRKTKRRTDSQWFIMDYTEN